MIDVLKKLAEIDAEGGLKESTQMVQEPAVAIISESAVQECGPMGMSSMPMQGGTPASFSVNASAASGDEVANMLTQILTLAGVKKDSPMDEPGKEPLTGEPPKSAGDDMKSAIQAIDQAEQEEAEIGGMDELGTSDAPEMGGEMGGMGGEPADVQDMAQDVQDMANQLKGKDKEDLGLEALDNEPQVSVRSTDPLNDFAQIINKVRQFDYVPAQSASNPMKTESLTAETTEIQEDGLEQTLISITNDLMKQYESFKAQ